MHTKAFLFLSRGTGSLILEVVVHLAQLWGMLLGIRLPDRHGLPAYVISFGQGVQVLITYECC